MNAVLFLSIFSILGIVYFILGIIASKNIKNTTDYFLAGRNLGLIPVTFTLIATQLGGGMLLGTAQEAYTSGYYGLLYTIGMGLGFLMLGLGFASRLQTLNVATTAELFETRYHSAALKKFASILSMATMCGLLIANIVASRTLLNGLAINNELVFLLFWAGIILYTMVGGLKAVVITDVAQVIFIIIVFGGIFLYSLFTEPCTFFSCTALIEQQAQFSDVRFDWSSMIPVVLMPALFSLIEQDLAQRFFASRTKQVAALSAICASIFMLLFALVPIYFGIKAKLLNLTIPAGTSPLISVLGVLTNEFAMTLAVCGIVAAITSTADSLLCAISSNMAQDFDFSACGITDTLKLSQYVTLITGIIAFVASYAMPPNIISILISSYELSVSCLLIPLVICYFKKEVTTRAAVSSITCGLFGFIAFRIFPIPFPKELATLGLSALGFFCAKLFKR
jgi:SSS family solute:Na+ symporter